MSQLNYGMLIRHSYGQDGIIIDVGIDDFIVFWFDRKSEGTVTYNRFDAIYFKYYE